ncbi:MAG: hypothetical protein GY797_08100 [Deltaproteobacteria bacterium]|nr:hypothetical protein [Deltaproteobacteria bacterium]
MNRKKSGSSPPWINRIETSIIIATAVVSGLVALLDFLGLLDNIPWLQEKVPTLTLLVGGLIAGYLAIERRQQLEPMQEEFRTGISELKRTNSETASLIIDSLKGVELRSYEDGHDLINYINERLSQASVQVDDLTWSPAGRRLDIGLDKAQKPAKEHFQRIVNVAQKISYREVFVFNTPTKISKLQKLLTENVPGYSCAYYENEANVPVLTFVIIDKEEVFLFSANSNFAIKHPEIVQLFMEYYEKIWDKAIPIKTGNSVNKELAERILSGETVQ